MPGSRPSMGPSQGKGINLRWDNKLRVVEVGCGWGSGTVVVRVVRSRA